MRTNKEIRTAWSKLGSIDTLADFERGENDAFMTVTEIIGFTEKSIEHERESLENAEPRKSEQYYLGYLNTLEWVLNKREKIKVEFT